MYHEIFTELEMLIENPYGKPTSNPSNIINSILIDGLFSQSFYFSVDFETVIQHLSNSKNKF